MFISDLAIAESDHDHKRHLDPLPSRWNTWQYPVPLSRVREFEDQLVHQLVVADGARDESGFYIRGVLRDEPFGIELPHSSPPTPPVMTGMAVLEGSATIVSMVLSTSRSSNSPRRCCSQRSAIAC